MSPEEIAEIQARLDEHGHLSRHDSQALLNAVRRMPTAAQIIDQLHAFGREFDLKISAVAK